MLKKFIGTKQFYRRIFAISVPIMIQNGITNFVSLLDNIMVGQVGTEEMSGVAIVNQLLFIFYLCIFGGLSGAGIFTAQYYGQRDDDGIRHTFRYKLWLGIIIVAVALIVFSLCGPFLINAFLTNDGSSGNVTEALNHGLSYMKIVLLGLPPIMIVNVYAGTLRDCGKTTLPMIASSCAVFVNLILDWILIFGHFGAPELGVEGAATATVIARYIEAGIVVIWCHKNTEKIPYIKGLYRTMKVPKKIVKEVFIKGTPLFLNEALWSAGIAVLMQCYSTRGITAVAALNIGNTINNLLNGVFIALGDTVAIIVGQLLGAGKMKEARDTDTKIIAFSVTTGFLVAICLVGTSFFFPKLYNTSSEIQELAAKLIVLQAVFIPQMALLHSSYFTLRSGGKTIVTFLFDSAFLWVISVPIAFCLSRYTGLPLLGLFAIINSIDLIKSGVGVCLVKKGGWLQTITV